MNNYKNYYGYETRKQIELLAGRVADHFDGKLIENDVENERRKNSYLMLVETACAETQLGLYKDNNHTSGYGICQFDDSGFSHTMSRSEKYFDTIYQTFRIHMPTLEINELRYNILISFIMCRLFYKTKKGEIPSTREGRAKYWKKYYNTSAGGGSVEHYMESCKTHLGEE